MDKYQKIVFSLEALGAILLSIAMSILLIWQVYSEVFIVLALGSFSSSMISRYIAKKKKTKSIKRIRKLFFIPINVIILFVLIKSALIVYPTWWNGISSLRWPSTNGTVLEKEFYQKELEDGGSLWEPIIHYQYSVDHQKYRNNVFSFYFFIFGKDWAERQVHNYTPNQSINVYYDPSMPGRSCLKTGPDKWGTIFAIGIGFVVILILIPFIKWLIRILPNQQLHKDRS